MSLEARRLQRHLREGFRAHAPATRAGPFTCYLHRESNDPALNVAVPDEPVEGRRVPVMSEEAAGFASVPPDDVELGLVTLNAHFLARRRTPRVEFLDECHPRLADALLAHGFTEDAPTTMLACTRETWRQVDPPAGVHVEPLLPTSTWEVAKRYLQVQNEAYELDMEVPAAGPKGFFPALLIGAGILASLDGEAAAAGGITPMQDGLTDVRGLAVRDAYRRRGLGAFVLSALGRIAHETGAEALIAIPDSEGAEALAAKGGFVPVATIRSFTREASAEP